MDPFRMGSGARGARRTESRAVDGGRDRGIGDVVITTTTLAATMATMVMVATAVVGCGDDQASVTSEAGSTGSTTATTGADAETATATADVPSEPADICDGSSALRFAMYLPTSIERVEPVSYVLWENGARFLFVFGDCSYWVSGPQNPTRSERYHTGQLTSEDAGALAETFHYGLWEAMELTGYWLPALDDFDVPTTVFFDGDALVVCSGGCGAPGVRPEVHAMRDAEQGWIDALWTAGSPVDGPIRVVAVRIADGDPTYDAVPPAQWPLATPVDDLAFPDPDSVPLEPGQSTRIDVPESQALIEIWEDYLAGTHGQLWRSHASIPFFDDEQGPRYRVFLRDALPLEDAQGLVDAPDIR